MIESYFDRMSVDRAKLGLRNVGFEVNDTLKDWVSHATEMGASYMRASAPRDQGALANAVRVEGPFYQPGGLGGGGSWVSKIDIDPFAAPHYRFVMLGTGLYRTDGGMQAPIVAKGNGPMIYEYVGRKWFMTSVQGQRPQREWFDRGVEIANEIIGSHARYDKPWTQYT